jgi:hypothetical protein
MPFVHDHRAHLAERLAKAQLAAGDSAITAIVPFLDSA